MPELDLDTEHRRGLTKSETVQNLGVLTLSAAARFEQLRGRHSNPDGDILDDLGLKVLNTDKAAQLWNIDPQMRRPTLAMSALLMAGMIRHHPEMDSPVSVEQYASVMIDRINTIDQANEPLDDFEPLTLGEVKWTATRLALPRPIRALDVGLAKRRRRVMGPDLLPGRQLVDSVH